MRRPALLGLLLCQACHAVSALEAEIPEEVEAVSLITVDVDGHVLEATPLARWDPSAGLPLRRPAFGAEHHLAGWSLSQLGASELPDGAPAEAGPCDPTLAVPRWYGAWTGAGVAEESPSSAPTLTAPWEQDDCSGSEDLELKLESPCLEARCDLRVEAEASCLRTLDARACGLGRIPVAVGRTASGDPTACVPGPPADCAVTVHAVEPGGAAPFTFERVEVRPDPPMRRGSHIEHAGNLHRGFVRDLLVLDDLIVAAGVQPHDHCFPWEEGEAQERFLSFIDAEAMVRTATRSTVGCVMRLANDPHGPGFFGASYEEQGWFLRRFDRSGASIEAVLIAAASDRPESDFRLSELTVLPEIDRIAVLFTALTDVEDGGYLIVVDATSLAPVRQIDLTDGDRPWDMVPISGRELALSLSDRYTLRFVGVEGSVSSGSLSLEANGLIGTTLMGLYFDPATERVFSIGNEKLYVVDPDHQTVRSRLDYASEHFPFLMARWPSGPDESRRIAVFGSRVAEDGSKEAGVLFFDLDDERFLPERYALSRGIVTRVRADAAGRLFVALPWSGEIGRLTPR